MSASDIGAAAVGNDYYANPDKYDVSKYYNTKNTYLAIYQEAIPGYLAGYTAVKLGYRHLGFLGGQAVPGVMRYGYGYVQGINAAAEEMGITDKVTIEYAYGGQFYGSTEITAAMDTWYSNETEVVFACGGGIFTSAAEAAAKVNDKIIGVDSDQSPIIDKYGKGMTVTSVMKSLTATVNARLDSIIFDGTWKDHVGQVENLGLVSNTAKTTGKISNAKAVDTAGKAAAKSAVKASIVNKIAAIAVAVGVLGGSAYGIVAWNNQRNQTAQMATATTESSNSTKNTSTSENKTSSATTEATTEQPKQKIKLSEVYKKVLTDVENGKYEFPDSQGNTDYYYFVRDMNKDGVKELIVAPKWSVNEYTNYDIRVFSCINSEEGYKLSVISGHKWISNLSTNGGVCIPSDGNGLLIHNFTKGTGQSDVHRMTIQNGKLVYGDTEQTFSMGDSEWDKFGEENPEATWTALSDKSKIEELQ